MDTKKNIWYRLSHLGLNNDLEFSARKSVILTNQISLALLFASLTGVFVTANLPTPFYRNLALLGGLCLLILVLNGVKLILVSRLLLVFLTPLVVVISLIWGNEVSKEIVPWISYTFLGLSILPFLLFDYHQERGIFYGGIIFYLAIILSYHWFLSGYMPRGAEVADTTNNKFIYWNGNLPEVLLFLFMSFGLIFVKKINASYETRLRETQQALEDSNEEIQSRNEEIVAQNEELLEKQAQIEKQNELLAKRNFELEHTKNELIRNLDKLIKTQQDLAKKEAEARSIINTLKNHFIIAEFDSNTEVLWINNRTADFFGIDADKTSDKQWLNSYLREHLVQVSEQNIYDKLSEVIQLGHSVSYDMCFKVNEVKLWIGTTLAPIKSEDGTIMKVLAIGQDITHIRQHRDEINRINQELQEKIKEISDQNEVLNFQQKEIFDKNETLQEQKLAIIKMNETLEERVQERTRVLEEKNKQLAEYAFINSHILRAPLSTLMGLINLIPYGNLQGDDFKLYEYLKITARELDDVVIKINDAIDAGSHFNRSYMYSKDYSLADTVHVMDNK